MLIIIKCDFVTAGTKCFLEHICNCLLKAAGEMREFPQLGEKKKKKKNSFRASFQEASAALQEGLGLQSAAPGQVLCVTEWVGRTPAQGPCQHSPTSCSWAQSTCPDWPSCLSAHDTGGRVMGTWPCCLGTTGWTCRVPCRAL